MENFKLFFSPCSFPLLLSTMATAHRKTTCRDRNIVQSCEAVTHDMLLDDGNKNVKD